MVATHIRLGISTQKGHLNELSYTSRDQCLRGWFRNPHTFSSFDVAGVTPHLMILTVD